MSKKLHFRISSGLKDIIGRELITDDEIAVFELVKNAYDAHASRVDVIFEDVFGLGAKITIRDNGKGMSLNDLENKWLFVAYSAKKEGTEDDDYRHRIYQHRAFAGAKGIGRFSCDRLGKKLKLYTAREESNQVEVLITDWEEFEENLKKQFATVEIPHEYEAKPFMDLDKGTILEITELRSGWDRIKIERLYSSLAKLIHPSETVKDFEIYLTCEQFGIVGRPVENFIFEALEIKTTKIEVRISRDGKFIITELKDGGTQIYKIKERNTSFPLLQNISISVFYLNQSAKLTFSNRMGVNTRDYGSIFLYKNNIRIYPFGEPGEDTLGLDSRKAQKPSLYIGNKDLIGRMEISGPNAGFTETSSRGSGFIINDTYKQFEVFAMEKVISRLEKYVIEVQKWGDGSFLSIEDDLQAGDKDQIHNKITSLIAKLTNSTEIVEVEYQDDFLSIVDEAQAENATSIVKNLFKLAKSSGNENLLKFASRTEKKVDELFVAFEEAKEEAKSAKAELKEKESENLFLKSIKSTDHEEVVSLLHHVGISSKNIENELKYVFKKFRKKKLDIDPELYDILQAITFENKKILSIAKFGSKANFKLYTESIEIDLVGYVLEYIRNILGLVSNQKPAIEFLGGTDLKFTREIKPIELNIIIDNLISNSRRAKAANIYISFALVNGNLLISFSDDGSGISEENAPNLFNFGFTTTVGSGIGLYHVKKMLEDGGNGIVYNALNKKLTEFIITINKN